MSRIKKKNRPIENDFICDNRIDAFDLMKKLDQMTEEEKSRIHIMEDEYKIIKVKYVGKTDTVAIDRNKVYEVLSIEKGWYRIMTEIGESYLFPPEAFEIVK